MFAPVTHVIFDLDGLLLDSEPVYFKIINDIADKYGKTYTHEVQAKILGTPENETVRIAVKELQLPITVEEFHKDYKDRSNKELGNVLLFPVQIKVEKHYPAILFTKESFSELAPWKGNSILKTGKQLFDHNKINILALPEENKIGENKKKHLQRAERLIRHFHKHNIPMALATSASQEITDVKIKNYQDLFSLLHHKVMGTSDPEVKNGKPHPDIFLVCASRFADNPKPAQCLVFEDAPNGVTAAIGAGMQVVMVPAKDTCKKLCQSATLVLESLHDFNPGKFGLPVFDE